VTGKLAVSLVNAPRVFEVFVTVVLIGKHFAASFALITGAAYTQTKLRTLDYATNFCNYKFIPHNA